MYNKSLCIPRVDKCIRKEKITQIINSLSLGSIDHIDIFPTKANKNQYSCVFIHFTQWYTDERTTKILQTLEEKKSIKVFYDDPWFWKITLKK